MNNLPMAPESSATGCGKFGGMATTCLVPTNLDISGYSPRGLVHKDGSSKVRGQAPIEKNEKLNFIIKMVAHENLTPSDRRPPNKFKHGDSLRH